MFRVVAILSLITATFVFSGCPKKKAAKPADKPATAKKAEPKKAEPKKDEAKKDEAKKDEAKKDEAKKDEAKKDEAKGATAMPENIKGVADCEAYFKAYNCYIGKLPAAGQGAAKKAMVAMTSAWAKIPKANLAATCKAALNGLKKSAANPAVKKFWDGCFPK